MKSINVENAANELISILCDAHQTARDEMEDEDSEADEDDDEGEGKVKGINPSFNSFYCG